MTTYDLRTRHSLDLHHYAKASNGTSVPSNWIPRTDGTSAVIWTPESAGGSVSYGSNSNEVSFANAPGASTLVSRADHVHKGVTSVSHSSNTYTGPVTLETEGSLYIVRSAANTYRLGSTGTGGGGGSGTLTTVKDEGANLSTAVVSLDFVGAGVTATGTTAVTVTIPGGSSGYLIDTTALDGTVGDEFDGASLNARWTRVTQTSGEEAYQQGPGASALRVTYSTGAAVRYIYQSVSSSTNETWQVSLASWDHTATGQMYSLFRVDTSGNGVGIIHYPNSHGIYLVAIAAGAYSSTLASQALNDFSFQAGQRIWLRLRKASGDYFGSYSLNEETFSPEISATPSAFTAARICIGRILGTDASDIVDWYRFNKTA